MTPLQRMPTAASQNTTQAPGTLLQRIPQAAALPFIPPPLQKTLKVNPTPAIGFNTAPQTPSKPMVEGFVAPPLEKVAKAPLRAPNAVSPATQLRPSWAEPDTRTNAAPALGIQSVRVESPDSLYVISCNVNAIGVGGVDDSTHRHILNGIYHYPEVMKLDGKDLTDKLVNLVLKSLPKVLPTFVNTGIALGTIETIVEYSSNGPTWEKVATIKIVSTAINKHVYRTFTISRFKPNSLMTMCL